MEEDCTGSQGPPRTVTLQKEKKKKRKKKSAWIALGENPVPCSKMQRLAAPTMARAVLKKFASH
jgi:hypothetical protein